jgi:hypothetical protein
MSLILGILAQTGTPPAPVYDSDYESIATVTVGSGGSSSITFSSIPSTYKHLQIRALMQSTVSSGGDSIKFTINSDTGSNYARHTLQGDGASAVAGGIGSTTFANTGETAVVGNTNIFTGMVLNILDYANTNKTKTFMILSGFDVNGSGGVLNFRSNLWNSTSAITRIDFATSTGSNISQYSSFALYGIKGV